MFVIAELQSGKGNRVSSLSNFIRLLPKIHHYTTVSWKFLHDYRLVIQVTVD